VSDGVSALRSELCETALLALDAAAEAISIVGNEESRAAIRALRAELAKEE
jgi:hypothetical protein